MIYNMDWSEATHYGAIIHVGAQQKKQSLINGIEA
jgi:hypothetical protein